jgi:hypothetical protein
MRPSTLLLALVLVIVSHRAAAAETDTPPARKKPGEAAMRSLAGTFLCGAGAGLSVAMLSAGGDRDADDRPMRTPGAVIGAVSAAVCVVGPSAGHFYAGESGRAWISSGVRAGGLVLLAAGLPGTFTDSRDDNNRALVTAGLVVVGGSMLYGIIDGPRAVGRHNRRLRDLQVTPIAIRARDGWTTGGAVSLSF